MAWRVGTVVLAVVELACAAGEVLNVTLRDDARNREVTAAVCMSGQSQQDLYVFAHGGGLYAADYGYLCDGKFPGVVARLMSPTSDDPMDLIPMAKDVLFLAQALPQQSSDNASSPLHGRLTTAVVLAGHSMGGAAVLLAGADAPEAVKAVAAIAPGFWGPQQSELLKQIHVKGMGSGLCRLPYLQVAGDQDCANSLALQALSIWSNSTSACSTLQVPRALAVLTGATHCQWTTPVLGSCTFDKPCPAPRLQRGKQQQLGLSLLAALGQGHMEDKLHGMGSQLAFVDQTAKEADLRKLKSYCPCGSELTV